MSPKRLSVCIWKVLLLTGGVMTSVSCSSSKKDMAHDPLTSRAWWKGDGIVGKPKILINLSTQRVHYYKGKELVGVSPISSGRESHGTVTGSYRILDKDIDHRSSLFGAYVDQEGNVVKEDVDTRKDPAPPGSKYVGASMRYFMRIFGGIGMHEGYLPGYPASHGCIRLPTKMAVIFFKETPEGTPVEITGHSSLAATESAIPIGADKIMDEPEAAPKPKSKPVAKTKTPAAVAQAAPKSAPKSASKSVPDSKSKLTVRRAIVDNKSKSSAGGLGSMFKWTRKPPRGSTIYLNQ